jgi:uncharacterized UBP type Zn finger protein
VKLNDALTFPAELNMGPYVEAATQDLTYDLTAVFMHTGSAFAGHYFVYLK